MLRCYRSAELSAAMSSTSVAAAVTKAVTNTRASGEEEAGAEFVHRVLQGKQYRQEQIVEFQTNQFEVV